MSAKPGCLVIVMRGLPGSGKTLSAIMLAGKLAGKGIQTEKIHSDKIRNKLRVPHTQEGRMTVYKKMFEEAKKILSQGKSVVLDGTFSRAEIVGEASELAKSFGARFYCVECVCGGEETKRVKGVRDKKLFSDAGVQALEKIRSEFENAGVPSEQVICLDTSVSLSEKEKIVEKAVERMVG